MSDLVSPLVHSPMMSRADFASPSINQVLTAAYTDGSPGQATAPTLFDSPRFAVSIFPVDGAGIQKAAAGFSVGLYRSIDGGVTYQLFATYPATIETIVVDSIQSYRWQARLLTKGADNVRVRLV